MSTFKRITFGKFKEFIKAEDSKEDKEIFINSKKSLLSYLLYQQTEFNRLTEEQISDLDNQIKKQLYQINSINEEENKTVYNAFCLFMFKNGLCLNLLSQQEKKELLTMDLSYKNCKKMFLNIFNKYIEDMENNWPEEIKMCYKERGFVSYCHCRQKRIIKGDNSFLKLIRDYFLLDAGKIYYKDSRDNVLFNEIKKEMEKEYPKLKEEYGMNKYLDKFLGYIGYMQSDYYFDEVSELLNKYDKQKTKKNIDESKPINQKQD